MVKIAEYASNLKSADDFFQDFQRLDLEEPKNEECKVMASLSSGNGNKKRKRKEISSKESDFKEDVDEEVIKPKP